MPRFRARPPVPTTDSLARIVSDLLRPENFHVGADFALTWDHVAMEEPFWELFRGRVLDRTQTRQRRRFEAWNLFAQTDAGRSDEPILSVKVDRETGELHVARAIASHVWEPIEGAGGAIEARETRRWVRELVGTIDPRRLPDPDDLRDELMCSIFQAVVGASRLPLTSVEAPHPAFTFGQWMYCAGVERRPDESWIAAAFRAAGSHGERVKLAEFAVRTRPTEESIALATDWPLLLRDVFNDVSLSPYTDFAARALRLVATWEPAVRADCLTHLLRQTCAHLTAYDLVRFHHRGANYPDALLLDEVLPAAMELARERPDLFDGDEPVHRLRRRGVRLGWLVRSAYRDHPVPVLPTSTGENLRVLPAPFERVPEEQIVNPARRPRRLFADDIGPLPDAIARRSDDLTNEREIVALGSALFLDRPLGTSKAPGEPDRTPLMSYVAFGPRIAAERARLLGATVAIPEVVGVAVAGARHPSRPGVVAIEDAAIASDDFRILRSTRRSLSEFATLFELPGLADARMLLRRPGSLDELVVYDGAGAIALEARVDASAGYAVRAGIEVPVAGLLVGDRRYRPRLDER